MPTVRYAPNTNDTNVTFETFDEAVLFEVLSRGDAPYIESYKKANLIEHIARHCNIISKNTESSDETIS